VNEEALVHWGLSCPPPKKTKENNIKKGGNFRNVKKYSHKEKKLLVKRLDYPELISVSTSALFKTIYGYAAHSNESAMINALNEMLKKKATRSVIVTNQQIDLLVSNGRTFIIYIRKR